MSGNYYVRQGISVAIVGLFVLFTIIDVDAAQQSFMAVKDAVVESFDWFFTLSASICLLATVWLALDSRINVRLGGDDERPEFSYLSWFCMLFSAGLASGLLYWATAEPLTHFQGSPHMTMAGIDSLSAGAAQSAITLTIFHWGFHGWGFYVLTGLAIAYQSYRNGLPLALRSTLHPLLGERAFGWPGFAVDLIGVMGTMFGVATSIGLAVAGMNAALSKLVSVDISMANQLIIVAGVSVLGTLSVMSGVARGIRRLSELNIWLTLALLLGVVLIGPTAYLLGTVVTSMGDYTTSVIPMGFWTALGRADQDWQGAWTVFYWGWWLAWTPFVALFVARISRGRTLREFVTGVMLVPTFVVIIWMSVFGGAAIHGELNGMQSLLPAVNADYSVGTTAMIERLGVMVTPLIMIITFLLFTWLITSFDSATLVICTLLKRETREISGLQKITWGILIGTVTGLLMYMGGVSALQAASIVVGLPVGVVVLASAWGLFKTLYSADKPVERLDPSTVG